MPSPEPENAPGTLLVFRGAVGAWGIPSEAISEVVHQRDWGGAAPLDALTALGDTVRDDEAHDARVLVLRQGGRLLPLLVRGRLSLLDGTLSQRLRLPRVVTRDAPLLAELMLQSGKPTLFVLSPERFFPPQQTTPFESAPPVENDPVDSR